jgi:hypothetical protein
MTRPTLSPDSPAVGRSDTWSLPILGHKDFDSFFGPDPEMKQSLGRTGALFVLFANLEANHARMDRKNEKTY